MKMDSFCYVSRKYEVPKNERNINQETTNLYKSLLSFKLQSEKSIDYGISQRLIKPVYTFIAEKEKTIIQ